MAKVRDPNGVELQPTLLHVRERDAQGRPTICRVRYDDEQIQLGDERDNHFLMLWGTAKSELVTGNSLAAKFEDLREQVLHLREVLKTTKAEIAAVTDVNQRITADLEHKTGALRDLQRERDPERFDRAVRERTADLERELDNVRADAKFATELAARMEATLRSRVTELEASKRKLREALERMKERR